MKGKIDQVTMLNVYAPPGSNKCFFRKLFDLIALETYGTLICVGDFKILLNPLLDTTNKKRTRNPTEKLANKALKDLGVIDVWHSVHGSDPGYTFYSARHTYFFMYDRFTQTERLQYRPEGPLRPFRALPDISSGG